MACPDWEELLAGGAPGHVAHCDECQARLEAWNQVDLVLESAFAGVVAPPGMAARARALAARPSPLPELLDFIGWAAVLAMAVIVVPRYLPHLMSVFMR